MAETYVELEQPLFLDEPPVTSARAVRETSDTDALLAFAAEAPRTPAIRTSGSILFVDAPAQRSGPGAALFAAVVLTGVAAGFGLVVTLLG